MSDAPPFALDELLQPLAEPGPSGIRLRTRDSVQAELRDLIGQAKKALEKEKKASESGNDPSLAGMSEWLAVKEQGEKLLKETSKDLEVAALMVSAAVRTDGLPGLVSGLELVAELVDQYWPEMFATAQAAAQSEQPPPDDEAIATDMLRLLDQWKEVLPGPIARIPLTEGTDAGSYALWQYEQAVASEKLSPEEREKRKAVTVGRIAQSASQTARKDGSYFPRLLAQLEEADKQADRIEAAFQTHLSNGLAGLGPSLTRVKERLDDIKRCLAHVAKDYLVPVGQTASASGNAPGMSSANSPASGPAGEPHNRDEAFRQLSLIADFFARTEPLSLLAEQIRQVVKRGRSSPEKYYAELIDNEDTLRQFFRLVGIQPSSEQNEESSSES